MNVMRVKVDEIEGGLHPKEVVVGVCTDIGRQHFVISRRTVSDGSVEIGYPIGENDEFYIRGASTGDGKRRLARIDAQIGYDLEKIRDILLFNGID